MMRITMTFLSLGLTTFLVGCSGSTGSGFEGVAVGASALNPGQAEMALPKLHPSLPPGHPPIFSGRGSLPPGHPAVPEGSTCPSGNFARNPRGERSGDFRTDAPELISI